MTSRLRKKHQITQQSIPLRPATRVSRSQATAEGDLSRAASNPSADSDSVPRGRALLFLGLILISLQAVALAGDASSGNLNPWKAAGPKQHVAREVSSEIQHSTNLKWRSVRKPQAAKATEPHKLTSETLKTASRIPATVGKSAVRQTQAVQDKKEDDFDPFADDLKEPSSQKPKTAEPPKRAEPMPTPDPLAVPDDTEKQPGGNLLPPLRPMYDPEVAGENTLTLTDQQNCQQRLSELRANTLRSWDLSKLDIKVRREDNQPLVFGQDVPFECKLNLNQYVKRDWEEVNYLWTASALCHKPLYFEQPHAERYGHEVNPFVHPIVAGAHFFVTLPILPYKMGLRTPTECVYALGHYRPGNCAPYMLDPIPMNWRAALFQAGATIGAVYVIP